MNGKELGGRTITVELSGRPPKGDRPARQDDYRSDGRGSFGGGGGRGAQGSSDVATKNLFVANIPETLNEGDVEQHFRK